MNGALKIEKGIPVPPPKSKNGYSLALRSMEAGDSVVLPISHNSAMAAASRILGAGNYTTRKEQDGIRVWRVK